MPTARSIPGKVKSVTASVLNGNEHLIHAVKNELMGRFNDLDAGMTALSEENAVLGVSNTRTSQLASDSYSAIAALQREVHALRDEVGFLANGFAQRASARLDDIDEATAIFLNRTHSHSGPLAEKDLWINNPVVIEWKKGDAQIGAVNERILEIPFVFQQLAGLDAGAKVLDVGGSESTVAFSLASLGYDTTIVDPQGYPFEHPGLEVALIRLEELDARANFDAVIFLSAVEHFGLGHYSGGGSPDLDADRKALESAKQALKPSGKLILTVPYGPAETSDFQRIYDLERLHNLLDGWSILVGKVGVRTGPTTWSIESAELVEPAGPNRVALVCASPA